MADARPPTSARPVEQPLNLIPVGLKEAALDSPTFRASSLHFEEQVDIIERWLDGYVRAASKLVADIGNLESTVNSFLTHSAPPAHISEAVLDHDYTLLAVRRYGEGAREFWNQTFRSCKKYESTVVEPIRAFLSSDLRSFNMTRRSLESAQKYFDAVLARYLGQNKTKEASSLREDAFQLHEARKAYVKASMDFCVAAPQLRATLDQVIVKVFAEQFRDMKNGRDASAATFTKLSAEMDRVRGWSREMENSERAFTRELLAAKKQIEDSALDLTKPSRELHDYELASLPYAAATTPAKTAGSERGEKQGWLFLKTLVGKPTKTIWVRRWFFVKNGIFGWLVQGTKSGGVEESEKTGVLLCGIRPAFQEERRFCFEVKTKDTSILLQAETQAELSDWITAFEFAKRKALEDPASTDMSAHSAGVDPAFAITQPIAPEFAAAKISDSEHRSEDGFGGLLGGAPEPTGLGIQQRASMDPGAARRVVSIDAESTRDRLMQKFDLHKRPANGSQLPQMPPPAGGIASLISSSHHALPIAPAAPPPVGAAGEGQAAAGAAQRRKVTLTLSTLAPNSLANPPAPTNLSHTAVIVSGERNVSLGGRADGSGMPGGIMANLWGSSNWGYVNRLGDDVPKPVSQSTEARPPTPARPVPTSIDDVGVMDGTGEMTGEKPPHVVHPATEPTPMGHRKTVSVTASTDTNLPGQLVRHSLAGAEEYPNYYPLALKAQHAQFKILFPSVPRSEKIVLVFRATWNPNEQQEFPGRVYVTTKEIYFYSHHLGLVLITGVSLASINEVTSAPGKDCDFLYLHLKEASKLEGRKRITVKVFLDSLRLLQRRLNYLVQNANSDAPDSLEEVIKTLIKMESEKHERSSSADSWEDLTYDPESSAVGGDENSARYHRERNIKASLRIDGSLHGETARTGREVQKFQLPRHPVAYAPTGMQASIAREFTVSAKALFHVIFGDKSAVFQLLYCNRWGDKVVQTPWAKNAGDHWQRRFTSLTSPLQDTQTVDILNDHLCYLVTNNRVPWRLPYSDRFHLTTKLVITHIAKSRSKLAIYQQISWYRSPSVPYFKRLIEKQALNTLEADALDLTNVVMDQVAKLGNHSKTNKAIDIFGNVGQANSVPQLNADAIPAVAGTAISSGRLQRVSLTKLVTSDLMVSTLQGLSLVFESLLGIGKGAVRLCTAHTLLVTVFLISCLSHLWHGYHTGMLESHERSAARYMARLGVRPDMTLGKSIYLADIDDLVAPTAPSMQNETWAAEFVSGSSFEAPLTMTTTAKTCRSTFGDQLLSSMPSSGSVGARLQRSRNSLARYRHDLLVALRVVNRVEKDIVLSEWEEWVRGEERRCVQVEQMLRSTAGAKEDGDGGAGEEISLERQLGAGFAEYCASCRVELGGIMNGTKVM
ncbi:hypothetical protein BDY17DRAFT_295237 [Neohortaea acidophila]|uniref:Transcription factor SipA3 n=1 Tax=Neohortaea acidophila TaxID=245834 RepID=A0A6A6PWX1_9PEZI|nr:uncharacterized protein BDY17DRAFT_295237 [Neohortaea acidophila]KAF2484224.1 hypothetical protein BDY17DRAFT_295237 [Neohortaea acidophila]